MVAALDPSGRTRPGWPVEIACGWSLVVAPDGSLLVDIAGAAGFELHRLSAAGRELPGWPYRDDAAESCEPTVVAADGTAFLACTHGDGGNATITALDPGGRVVPGWPVTLWGVDRFVSWWRSAVQLGSSGTLYAMGMPPDDASMTRLWAFGSDGRRRPGFPVTMVSRVAGYAVVPGNRVLVGEYIPPEGEYASNCGTARETLLTELDGRGRVVTGWPVTANGWASPPAIGPEGTLYYLTNGRLFARAADGSLRAGWPVAIPPAAPECEDTGPWLATDGAVFVRADGLRAFGRDGRPLPGWPYRLPNGAAGYGCVHPDRGLSPAFGPGGRVYVPERPPGDDSVAATEIAALDAAGRPVAGWPFRVAVPETGQLDRLDVDHGRLYVTLATCTATGDSTMLLAVDPDGALAD